MAKMTKNELREDPVLEWLDGAIVFLRRNLRWILTGAIIVVAVFVGAITLTRSHKRSEMEAAQVLMDAQRRYLQGAYPAAEVQLQQLLTAYPRSQAAPLARIYLGDALLGQGRHAEALAAFEEATGARSDDPALPAAAHRGKASALESLARFAEASRSYEEAAGVETPFQLDDVFNAGRAALQAGDPSRAQALLEQAQEMDDTRGRTAEIDFYLAQAESAQR